MKYGDRAASTRQRLLQYVPYLQERGITFHVASLLDNNYVSQIGQEGGRSARRIGTAYARRIWQLASSSSVDVIWVYGEMFPFLPAVFEQLVFLRGRPVIYDYDDAFFHQYDLHPNKVIRATLGKKLQGLLGGVSISCCGNAYLKEYAAKVCRECVVVPTVVDTTKLRPPASKIADDPVVVGWIGSPTTWAYVEPFLPLIERICTSHKAVFKVIGAGKPIPSAIDVDWSEDTEVAELQGIDIGIMPLPDEPWARGKCGYKLIQYMACGSAVVASPVGVNTEIIDEGQNGFVATTEAEWEQCLGALIRNPELRARMGRHGREKVEARYSLHVHAPRIEEVIRAAADGRRAQHR